MTRSTRIRQRIIAWLINQHCRHLDATTYRQQAPWGVS